MIYVFTTFWVKDFCKIVAMKELLLLEVQKTIFLRLGLIEIESADPCPVISEPFSHMVRWAGCSYVFISQNFCSHSVYPH